MGYDEKAFGYFFSLSSLASMVAPFVFSKMSRKFSLEQLPPNSFAGVLAASLALTTTLLPLPYHLAVAMWLLTFFFAFMRPPGSNLLLEQVDRDAGAASSLMVFFYFMSGSLCMWFISQDWHDKIIVMGWIGTISSTLTLLGRIAVNRLSEVRFP